VRDELHTAQITSKVAKLIFELSVPDQMNLSFWKTMFSSRCATVTINYCM